MNHTHSGADPQGSLQRQACVEGVKTRMLSHLPKGAADRQAVVYVAADPPPPNLSSCMREGED